jgi:selenocysteine-specific elongation factor
MDVELELLPGAAPRPGQLVRALIGTSESPARLRRTKAGGVRLACERALCALAGERFILRDDAARRTLGGGRVLVPRAQRNPLTEKRLRDAEEVLLAFVDGFHERYPTREGVTPGACRDAVGDTRLYEAALARLEGRVEAQRGYVRRKGFDALGALPAAERECAERLERAFLAGGLTPPRPEDLVRADAQREAVYRLLVARGRLIRVAGADGRPVVFHRDAVERARVELGRAFPPPAQFTVAQARERLSSTRKFVVPLLEFLDASRFTRRAGDLRTFLR